MEWISVKDRLPARDTLTNNYSVSVFIMRDGEPDVGYCDYRDQTWDYANTSNNTDVTHWMYVPLATSVVDRTVIIDTHVPDGFYSD